MALYGCAWLDGWRESGWACIAGREPTRFTDLSSLDPAITWWTTLTYDERYRGGRYGPNLLFDRHLTLSPLSALRERGLDLAEAGAASAAALLGADVLARVRGITDAGVSGEAHRGIVRAIGAGWKPDHGADKAFASPTAWEEFVATAMRGHKGSDTQIHREPRLDHARTVLATKVPVGPYEHVDLEGNPVPAMRRRYVDNHASVAFVRILAAVDAAQACPVRSPLWTSGGRPAWVAKPVYDLLRESMDVTPLAAMVAPGMRPAAEHLPDAAKAFLDRADPESWADGVVAEAVWRSGLSSAGPGTGEWQAGLPASYLRAMDLAAMCREAVRLREDGASVSSYGLGWVRYTRPA